MARNRPEICPRCRTKGTRRSRGGIDPGAVKQSRKAEERKPKAESVETVFADFVRLHAKPNTRGWKETERILREFSTAWEGRTMASITRGDIPPRPGRNPGGAPIAANRSFAAVRKAFVWAVSRGITEASPCAGISMPSAIVSRDRVLDDNELRAVWLAAEGLGYPYGPIVRLLVLTGQRRAEVAGMRWGELDLPNRTWTIPAIRAKNGRKHEVPLSSQVIAVIESLPRFASSDLLFGPSGKAPSGYSEAKTRIDKALPADMPGWTFHDVRRSVASGMAAGGTDLHVIERCLNHVSGTFGGIVSVYQKHNYAGQMRAALEALGRHIETITSSSGQHC